MQLPGSSQPNETPSDSVVAPEAARAQLERIVASPAFAASAKRKAMLRFVVEETLAGRADRLKGYAIASAVFGRDETFDAQSDPVVRLEARRLRRDLDGYYATEGAGDPLRITIPKGAYAVAFETRDNGAAADEPEPSGAAEEPVAGVDAPPQAVPSLPGTALRGRMPALLGAGLATVVLLLAVAGAWLWTSGGWRGTAVDTAAHGPTVIVLPFETLSAEEDDRYLASGMTTELISNLMRFDGFRLYSVPASFRQDADADPRALGRDLAVSYVVRGSVQSAGDTVRINASLMDARTDEVLWSERLARPLTPGNLLDLQAELAGQIASTLGQAYGVVNTDAGGRLRASATPSMPTYQCILRAYEYRRTFAVDLHGPVVDCLEAAVRRDPDYADAWALLAWLKLDAVRYDLLPEGRDESVLEAARAASARAVVLDPNSVRALQALSVITFYSGDYAAAERAQRQALALNPNDPETLVQLGWRLAVRGDFEEGLGYVRRAIDRSVNPPGWYYLLIAVHDFMQGDYAAALAAAEHSGRNGSEVGLSLMAMSQAALGDTAAARQSLATLEAIAPEFFADPEAVYRTHQATDEIVEALLAGLRQAGWPGPR